MNIPDVPAFAFRTLSMILQLLQYIQPYSIEGGVVELPMEQWNNQPRLIKIPFPDHGVL